MKPLQPNKQTRTKRPKSSGTPIGEMWDLEALSELCEKEKRWSFFLTSAPLHVKGGVGSPPGAIAIF
jgi:hypothetical protein